MFRVCSHGRIAMQPTLPFDLNPMLPRDRLSHLDQLVRSELGGRTYDEISWAAFHRLKARFSDWDALVEAGPAEVEPLIADVTYARAKAVWMVEALRTIKAWRGELSLDFLGELPTEIAFRKLKNLMGVGSKVAASVLNFSTFARPLLVVDTHVARVARRLGLTSTDDLDRAHEELMGLVQPTWDATDLYELHRLMKRFGQTICRHHETACHRCPLAPGCPSAATRH